MTKKNIDREALFKALKPGDSVWLNRNLVIIGLNYYVSHGDELLVTSDHKNDQIHAVLVKDQEIPIYPLDRQLVFAEEDEG